LKSTVRLPREWLLDVVQRESVVVGVHHVEQSRSIERPESPVIFCDSPSVERGVSARVIVVVLNDLLGNVDSPKGDEGRVRFLPFGEKVVDGIGASVLLELDLEVEAIILSSESRLHVDGQIISGGSGGKRESNGRNVSAWPNSVFDGGIWKSLLSKLIRRNAVMRHSKLGRNAVVGNFHGANGGISRIFGRKRGSASISSSAEFRSRLDERSESRLVLWDEYWESVEHNIEIGVVLEAWKNLSSWNVQNLHG